MARFDSTYRGLVVRTNDPQASARVVLRIPQVLGTAESAWARPSAFTSSVPKVGDSVYVTFEGGDLAQPVYTPLTTLDDTVIPIPKPPTAVNLASAIHTSDEGVSFVDITAVWTAPTENQDGSVPVHLAGYLVYSSPDGELWGSGEYADANTFVAKGLLPGRTYFFRVASVNETLGRSATYATAQITVAAATPPPGSLLGQQATTLTNIQTTLTNQQGLLDGKAEIFVQSTDPSSGASPAWGNEHKGDIWINNGVTPRVIKTWSGSAWIEADSRTAQVVADVSQKITTFYAASTATPTATAVGDLWVVTNQNNILKRASAVGAANWVDVSDTRIAENATALTSVQTTLTGQQGQLDGKSSVYVQGTQPHDSNDVKDSGDIWIDTANNRVIKTYNGTDWVLSDDTRLAQAVTDITTKITTFYAASGSTPTATAVGDLWVVTNDNNRIKRASAVGTGGWVFIDDQRIATKTQTFAQDGIPVSKAVGDLWVNTTGGLNKYYIAKSIGADAITAGEWEEVTDKRAQDAVASATFTSFQSSLVDPGGLLDGKSAIYYTSSDPSVGASPAFSAANNGDLWVNSSTGRVKTWANAASPQWQEMTTQQAADATLAAQYAQSTADAVDSVSTNSNWTNWTATTPDGWNSYGGNGPSKETVLVRTPGNAARFNCVDNTLDRGLQTPTDSTSSLYPLPTGLQYVTMTADIMLNSGTTFNGSGILLDWTGMTGTNRAAVGFATEVPAPVVGKWYRVTKVIQRPATATGTQTRWSSWLMGNYSGHTTIGTKTVKDVVVNRLSFRPSSTEEIAAFNAAPQSTVTALTTTVSSKIQTFYNVLSSIPTSVAIGDLWVPSDTPNAIYRAAAAGANTIAAGAWVLISQSSPRVVQNGSFNKTFYNVVGYSNQSSAVTDNIVIDTPITHTNVFFRIKITGYQYNVTTNVIDLDLGGYARSIPDFGNPRANSTGSSPITVRYARNAAGTMSIILSVGVGFSYPRFTVTEAQIGYNTLPPDSWLNGWSVSTVPEANITTNYTLVTSVNVDNALATATTALTAANGKSKVTYSTAAPGTAANSLGDIWFQYVTGGTIIAQWTGKGGTTWEQNVLRDEVIASVNAGKILTGALQAATTITVGTPGGARVDIAGGGSLAGITAFDGAGNQTFRIDSATGAATFKGSILSGSTITGSTLQTATTGARTVLRPGVASNGYGNGVMEIFSGNVSEETPAEIFTIADGAASTDNISLFMMSPKKTGYSGRAMLQLFAADADTNAFGILKGQSAAVKGDLNAYISAGTQPNPGPNRWVVNDDGLVEGYSNGTRRFYLKDGLLDMNGQVNADALDVVGPTGNRLVMTGSGTVGVKGGLSDLDDTGWVTCTLNAPYVWQGTGGSEAIQVRKRFGVVYIRGAVNSSSVTVNATHTVASLPSGFAPVKNVVNQCGTSVGAASAVAFVTAGGDLQIRTNGTLSAYYFFGGFTWLLD